MSPVLRIRLETRPLERVEAPLLVVGVFEDERPLRGAAGRVDWRLCGLLSERVADGSFAGRAGEAALVGSAGRLAAPSLLATGLGPVASWGGRALEEATRGAFARVAKLGFTRAAAPIPGVASDEGVRHARAWLESALAGLDGRALELALCVAEEDEARMRRELVRCGRSREVEVLAPPPLRIEGPEVAGPAGPAPGA